MSYKETFSDNSVDSPTASELGSQLTDCFKYIQEITFNQDRNGTSLGLTGLQQRLMLEDAHQSILLTLNNIHQQQLTDQIDPQLLAISYYHLLNNGTDPAAIPGFLPDLMK